MDNVGSSSGGGIHPGAPTIWPKIEQQTSSTDNTSHTNSSNTNTSTSSVATVTSPTTATPTIAANLTSQDIAMQLMNIGITDSKDNRQLATQLLEHGMELSLENFQMLNKAIQNRGNTANSQNAAFAAISKGLAENQVALNALEQHFVGNNNLKAQLKQLATNLALTNDALNSSKGFISQGIISNLSSLLTEFDKKIRQATLENYSSINLNQTKGMVKDLASIRALMSSVNQQLQKQSGPKQKLMQLLQNYQSKINNLSGQSQSSYGLESSFELEPTLNQLQSLKSNLMELAKNFPNASKKNTAIPKNIQNLLAKLDELTVNLTPKVSQGAKNQQAALLYNKLLFFQQQLGDFAPNIGSAAGASTEAQQLQQFLIAIKEQVNKNFVAIESVSSNLDQWIDAQNNSGELSQLRQLLLLSGSALAGSKSSSGVTSNLKALFLDFDRSLYQLMKSVDFNDQQIADLYTKIKLINGEIKETIPQLAEYIGQEQLINLLKQLNKHFESNFSDLSTFRSLLDVYQQEGKTVMPLGVLQSSILAANHALSELGQGLIDENMLTKLNELFSNIGSEVMESILNYSGQVNSAVLINLEDSLNQLQTLVNQLLQQLALATNSTEREQMVNILKMLQSNIEKVMNNYAAQTIFSKLPVHNDPALPNRYCYWMIPNPFTDKDKNIEILIKRDTRKKKAPINPEKTQIIMKIETEQIGNIAIIVEISGKDIWYLFNTEDDDSRRYIAANATILREQMDTLGYTVKNFQSQVKNIEINKILKPIMDLDKMRRVQTEA